MCIELHKTALHCSVIYAINIAPLKHLILEISTRHQVNMSSSPTGCCAVQWAMWKGGGLTSRDRLDSSENYLLLGFLLVRLSQTVLLLVRQPITHNNCSISVSYRSSSNVTRWKNLLTLENKMKLLKRVELGQETIKNRNEEFPFFL